MLAANSLGRMASSSEPVTLLHVDDDPAFRDLAATALERIDDDLAVRSAPSAADGLALLYDDETAIDCVLSDFEMPRMDGLEFLVAARAEFPDIPFVLLTGKGNEDIASRAISAGVTDYLQKEPGLEQFTVLANRVEIYVERARERSRLESLERELAFWKEFSPAVVVVDHDGVVTSASATCRDLFRVDELEELLGVPIAELVHPEEREELRDVMEEVQHTDDAVTCHDRTLVRFGGEHTQTTVQWRTVDHWGEEALLAVLNEFPPSGAASQALP